MSSDDERKGRSQSPVNGETVADSTAFFSGQASCESEPLSGTYPPSSLSDWPDTDPQLVIENDKYVCRVCVLKKRDHRLLRDPVQTACGHRLCRTCVADYLGDEKFKICPANEADCELVTLNETYPDPGCQREIKNLLVYCPLRTHGCNQKVKFASLQKHVTECLYRNVNCIYQGCNEPVQFLNLEKHVTECKYRPVTCEQCGMELCFNSKEEHDTELCPEAIVNCPFSCGRLNLKRRQLEDHKSDCPRKPKECQFKYLGCTFTGSNEEVARHQQDVGSHFHVLLECLTSFKMQTIMQQNEIQELRQQLLELSRNQERIEYSIKNVNKELKLKMVQYVERLIIAEQKMEELTREVTNSSQDLEHTRQSIEQLKALIPQVSNHDRQLASHDIHMAEMNVRFQMIETANYDGILLWKICDFSKRKKDAIDGRTVSLYSQPFYTGRLGYKMCGRVYLNGDGIGRGTHMSLYFVMMKGEYDALLPWPFQSKVSLMLLDQSSEKRHLKDEFLPDPASSSFRRPLNTEMNIASGCPLFVAHTVLDNSKNHYIKDDVLFIKIMVDTTNIPPV